MVSTRSPGRLLARYIHFYIFLREPRFLFIFLLLYTLLLCGGTAMVTMVGVTGEGGGYGGDGGGGDGGGEGGAYGGEL